MVIERNLIISLLKLTREGAATVEDISKDAKIPSAIVEKLLQKLQSEDIIYLRGSAVEASSDNRLILAIRAASLGADVEHVSSFLRWQEFEDIAAVALERNGYVVAKNVRFKNSGRRWEIDLVGCKKPVVLCVDCKHWTRGVKPSALRKIVTAQVERTVAFAGTLPSATLKFECVKWNKARFIPVILSLIPSSFKFYDKVPVVPVLQLQDFLVQLPMHVESLKYFTREFSHL